MMEFYPCLAAWVFFWEKEMEATKYPNLIPIQSREAKGVLAEYLKETEMDHYNFLVEAGKQFGKDLTIYIPEDPELRRRLVENAKRAKKPRED